jgi:hypothetical protein
MEQLSAIACPPRRTGNVQQSAVPILFSLTIHCRVTKQRGLASRRELLRLMKRE